MWLNEKNKFSQYYMMCGQQGKKKINFKPRGREEIEENNTTYISRTKTKSLFRPGNRINLGLSSSVQLQSFCKRDASLHDCRILIQQFSQLFSLNNKGREFINTSFFIGGCRKEGHELINTSFFPNSAKK